MTATLKPRGGGALWRVIGVVGLALGLILLGASKFWLGQEKAQLYNTDTTMQLLLPDGQHLLLQPGTVVELCYCKGQRTLRLQQGKVKLFTDASAVPPASMPSHSLIERIEQSVVQTLWQVEPMQLQLAADQNLNYQLASIEVEKMAQHSRLHLLEGAVRVNHGRTLRAGDVWLTLGSGSASLPESSSTQAAPAKQDTSANTGE